MSQEEVLVVTEVSRHYSRSAEQVAALNRVSITLEAGEFLALVGASGSGKTTLLNIVGLVDAPDSGSVAIGGEVVNYSDVAMTLRLRRTRIGYIFQNFRLLPDLTAHENVMLSSIISGVSRRAAEIRADELLEKVGLSNRRDFFPRQLSGGQMQRVAVCRALATKPLVVLADEPTGNLDEANGRVVLELLKDATATGVAVVMATHSVLARSYAQRALALRDGTVVPEAEVLGVQSPQPRDQA